MKKETEIEVRCRVKKPEAFVARLRNLDSAAVFPNERGEALERNFVFEQPSHVGSIFRLRERIFPSGRHEYIYTVKGPNQSTLVRKKTEQNQSLSKKEFCEKLMRFDRDLTRTFVYERIFRPEHYQCYKNVEVELFQFPYLGWWTEFELKRGTPPDLERVTKIFTFTLKDNNQDSVKELSRALCRKEGIKRGSPIPWVPALVFDALAWKTFCDEHAIRFVEPIHIPGRRVMR